MFNACLKSSHFLDKKFIYFFTNTGNYEQATITTISIVALIALSIMVWFVYAYFFPHSWSGQLLIKVNK